MNIQSSSPFFKELIESDIFTEEQKDFIKNTYEKHNNIIKSKISKNVKYNAFCGRPQKIKDKENFNIFLNYYKRNYISMKTICKIFKISKASFFRYLKTVYKDIGIIKIQNKDVDYNELESIFNKFCFDYANIWVDKLYTDKYKEDMMQELLTELWSGVIEFHQISYDDRLPFKAFCNNICSKVFRKYINILKEDKKILKYDSYYSDDNKYNYLDKYIIDNDEEE